MCHATDRASAETPWAGAGGGRVSGGPSSARRRRFDCGPSAPGSFPSRHHLPTFNDVFDMDWPGPVLIAYKNGLRLDPQCMNVHTLTHTDTHTHTHTHTRARWHTRRPVTTLPTPPSFSFFFFLFCSFLTTRSPVCIEAHFRRSSN